MRHLRKWIAWILLACIFTSTIYNTTVFAKTTNTIENYKYAMTSRLMELEEIFSNEATGQYGLLFEMRIIVEYSMYVKHLSTESSYEFTDNEKIYYQRRLNNLIAKFNARFSNDSDAFLKCKLKGTYGNNIDSVKNIQSNLIDIVPTYLSDLLDKTQKEYDNSKTKKTLLEEKGTLLANIYKVFLVYQDTATSLTNLTEGPNGSHPAFSIDGSTNNSTVTKKISDIASKYKTLLQYGKTVATEIKETPSLDVGEDAPFVEIFSDAVATDKGYEIPNKPTLTLPYLALFSASSVYTPLESYVGDSAFTKSVESIVDDDVLSKKLLDVYGNTKDFKKPLYKRALDSEGNPTGPATLITVEEFINDIQKGNVGSLVTVKGNFEYDKDETSWVYQQLQSNLPVENDKLVDPDNPEDDAEEDEDNTVEEDSSDKDTSKDNTSTNNTPENASNETKSVVEKAVKKLFTKVKDTTAAAKYLIKNSKPYRMIVGTSLKLTKQWLEYCKNTFTTLTIVDRKVGKSTAYADNKIDYSNNANFAKSITDTIFIGDSRTVGLQQALLSFSGVTSDNFDNRQVFFFAQTGASFNYFNNVAVSKVNTTLKNNNNTNFKIIFNFGVNDVGSSEATAKNAAETYASRLNALASGDWAGQQIIVESVGAVIDGKSNASNAAINKFNETMQAKLNSEIKFVNVTSDMLSSDGKSLNGGYNSSDGLHYDAGTYVKLITKVFKAIEGTDSSNPTSTNSTISDEAQNSKTEDNEDGKGDEGNYIFAYSSITDEAKIMQPVLMYGTKYSRNVDNMTTMILTNILKSSINLNMIQNKNSRYLYMNAYGDIVLDDNLVVLPGAANPLFTKESKRYNIYTVAFMNSYPSVMNKSIYFQVASNTDIGKYMFMSDSKSKKDKADFYEGFLISSSNSVKSTTSLGVLPLNTTFYVTDSDYADIMSEQRIVFGSKGNWRISDLYDYSPIVFTENVTINDKGVFPYVVGDDTNYEIASAIARNYYRSLTHSEATGATENIGTLYDNYILHNVIISILGGTTNSLGYAKHLSEEQDIYGNNSTNRIYTTLVRLSKNLFDTTSKTDSVIGLKSAYEDPLLGKVFTLIRDNWYIFFIVIAFILLFAFMKLHRNLTQTAFLLITSLVAVYLFIYIVPVYLPMFYNVVINNVCENLTYEILSARAEQYDAKSGNDITIDSDGNFLMNTSSLTLYRVGANRLAEFHDSLGVKASDVTGGKTSIINQEAGVFAEGDSIKVNTDLLYENLEISGEYKIVDGVNVYQIAANKCVSSNIDYYVPYYQLVDGFVEKLNTLARVYDLPRKTTKFSDGKYKNNYLVNAYTHSTPFLTPGSYNAVEQEETTLNATDYAQYKSDNEELAEALNAAFGPNADWIGCSDFLFNLSENSKKTLWAQTLQRNGFYDSNWEPNEEKLSDLVTYINRQTKDFIFDMEDQIGSLSDSVLIKVIATRALIAFTQHSSQLGNWEYPFSLNYAELSLKDVCTTIFTQDYAEFINMDLNPVSYVNAKYGWFHLIFFDILVVLMFLITNIIKILVPVMYILLGIMILVKLITFGDMKRPLRGYLITSLTLFALLTLYNFCIVVAKLMVGSPIAIYFLVAVCIFILVILISLLKSILKNVTDLGDNEILAKISGITDGFSGFRQRFETVNVNNIVYSHKQRHTLNHQEDLGYSRFEPYREDLSVDSVNTMPNLQSDLYQQEVRQGQYRSDLRE